MDLSLNETQELLQRSARDFLKAECPISLAHAIDSGDDSFPAGLWRQMAELGWTGMMVPEQYGGFGGSVLDLVILSEELGRVLAPAPFHSTAVLAALLLTAAGGDEQRRRLLPAIARGEQVVAYAATERDYSWGPEGVQVRAAQAGSHWTLNGTKLFVHDAASANSFLVLARTGDGETDLTLFLVPAGSPGVSVRRVSGWAGERQYEVAFQHVTAEAVGAPGSAWRAVERAYPTAAVALSGYKLGAMAEVFEFTTEYARTRHQFGAPIGTFQRVQDHLIDMVNHVDGTRWTTYEAAWKLDAGKPDAAEAASIAKAVASEGFYQTTLHAHEVHAGIGASLEYPLHLYTRKARTLYDYLGSPGYHKKLLAQFLKL